MNTLNQQHRRLSLPALSGWCLPMSDDYSEQRPRGGRLSG